MTLDTHAFIKKLQESGIPIDQAEAICYGVQSGIDCKDLATKADLNEAIKDLRTEIHQEMRQLGNRFFFSLGTAAIGIVSFLQYFKN